MEGDPFARLRALICGTLKDPADWNIVLVALGDSVTQGLTVNPHMLGEDTYHAILRRELHRQYPDRSFSTINAGVNGDSSEGALLRLERDVMDHHPHLVTVSFGLNDSSWGEEGIQRFGRNLTEIVTRTRESGAAVVLMTPNMMAKRDNGHVDPNWRHVLDRLIQRQTSGLLGRYAQEVRRTGATTDTPVADVYAEWERREAQGEDMCEHLAGGLNHPDAYAHRIAGELLCRTVFSEIQRGPRARG